MNVVQMFLCLYFFFLLWVCLTCNSKDRTLTISASRLCHLRCDHIAWNCVCKHPASWSFLFVQEVRWATSAAAFDKVREMNNYLICWASISLVNLCFKPDKKKNLTAAFTNRLDVETINVAVSALCYITYVLLFQGGNEELLEGKRWPNSPHPARKSCTKILWQWEKVCTLQI